LVLGAGDDPHQVPGSAQSERDVEPKWSACRNVAGRHPVVAHACSPLPGSADRAPVCSMPLQLRALPQSILVVTLGVYLTLSVETEKSKYLDCGVPREPPEGGTPTVLPAGRIFPGDVSRVMILRSTGIQVGGGSAIFVPLWRISLGSCFRAIMGRH